MTEILSNIQEQGVNKTARNSLGKFRLRVCKSADVPILVDFLGLRQDEIIFIDLPVGELNENVDRDVKEHDCADFAMNEEQENSNGPLIFDFLSLSKLEERCNADSGRFRGHQVIIPATAFDCNPLGAAAAFSLRNRLMSRSLPSLDKRFLNMPIWIAANAEDNLGSIFLGFHFLKGKLSTFHTRCLGLFGKECEAALHALLLRFDSALEGRSKAMALYKILGKNVSSAWSPGGLPSNITLTFKWEISAGDYLSNPSPSATAVFHISPGWKDKRIALLENTEELEYLLIMACVLDSGATMIWPSSSESTHNAVLEAVRLLVIQYRVQSNEPEHTAHKMRHVDFTELLWDILKKCGSFETLVAALNIVFDALKQCRINAILHEDNKSTIARLIRDAQSRNLMLPRLETLTSIQILLEIGVERFRRDMIQAYIAAGFMTNESDLDLKPQLDAVPEERARALLPLHLALQTMLEIKRHLTLPAHMLTAMTRSVISKYCSSPITDVTKVFYETAVPLIHVQPDLLQKLPDLWTNETVYSHGNFVVASTLTHFTRDPQLRFLEGKVKYSEEDTEETQELDRRSSFLCTYTTGSFLNAEELDEWD
ncbi:hypothetical protein RB195_013976 [Necator americanus]|uniref:Protein zwilch n=1 Tax=Necator americanus TaxID=51031 RepID=A0ABR1DZ78_NECAM